MITKEQVTKFAIRARKINLLNGKQKEEREAIVTELRKGATLPTDGPYTIDLSCNGGKDFSWEEEYEKLLVRMYVKKGNTRTSSVALAAAKMKKLKEEAPDKKADVIGGESYVGGIKLLPRLNEKYKRQEAA